MSTKRISVKMTVALILCMGLLGSIGGCGTDTTTVIFIPSQVTAQFAVFEDTTEAVSGTTSAVYAGAIFWQGLITREVVDGLVEVVEPGGTRIPLSIAYNALGAPYYIVPLASPLQLNQQYTFRVTLEDGSILENSITTPANSLAITSPALGATMTLVSPLIVGWTNDNPGKNAAIVLRQERTAPFFSVVGAGRVQAPDTGNFDGTPPPIPGTAVQDALEPSDLGTPGVRYLTVTRSNASGVNGFLAASFIQASLVYALEVQIP